MILKGLISRRVLYWQYVLHCIQFLIRNAASSGETSHMEAFVIGGSFANILQYPHAAFLTVTCITSDGTNTTWICGSSLINQQVLITAAHCVFPCTEETKILVNVGHTDRDTGNVRSAISFYHHEYYDPKSTSNDIALIKLYRSVGFERTVRRVAIMRNPPYDEQAHIAGWGVVDDDRTQTLKLKKVDQNVYTRTECELKVGKMPNGTICASAKSYLDSPAPGDSGSGLMVRDYILIGLVSYRVPIFKNNVVVYTDVAHFYNWITRNTERIYCAK